MKTTADIIVVGTDTGVGKSVVSLLLMHILYAKGYVPFYLKPFQTGCKDPYDMDSDAAFVYRHTAALKDKDPAPSVIHCYPNPKAPFFAARDAGETIYPVPLCQEIERKRAEHNPLVVEAAGGLMVPLTHDVTIVELISMIKCRPLLVARAGLGTINHTLLSIEALHRRKIEALDVVLVESRQSPTDPDLVAENIAAIETFSGIQVSGVIPHLSDFDSPPAQAYQPLEQIVF